MKTKQKQWLLNLIISAIVIVGSVLIAPTLPEAISIRIVVIIVLGLFILIPVAIIIGLIKKKIITKNGILLLFFY